MIHRSEPYGTACLLFLFSFLFFHLFRIPVPLNVDTYLYARAIETFEGPAIHFGYYLIGALCHAFLKPIGVTPLETLGYVSQFFGGISVAGMYVFIFLLTENRLLSLLSAAVLMFSGAFWLFSIHGEVYVPQLGFVLLSLIGLLKIRPLLSSLFILVAVSISPTSLLALIPAGYVMHMRRFSRKHLMAFAGPILLGYAVVMLWDGPSVIEAFAGAIHTPTAFVAPFSYTKFLTLLMYQLMRAYGNSFNFICLFAVVGLVFLYSQDKRLWGLMLAFLLPFSAYFLNLGLFSGDHLIISFIAVSFFGAYGMLRLLDKVHAGSKTRIIFVTLFVCLHFLITYERAISRKRAYAAEMGRVVHVLSEKYPPNGVMLTDFDFGTIFFSMMGKDYPLALLKGNPNEFLIEKDSQAKEAMEMLQGKFWLEFAHLLDFASRPEFKTLLDERPIYLVDRKFWPIGMIQVYLALREMFDIEERKEPGRVENIREYLAYKLAADVTVEKIVESPLYPVYVMQPVSKSAK
ncbi:MAG: hypothetical protein U5R49_09925 [Deltaproteobacteria bacterium]|nr:hypothetical protein [Deltaproteobacteria bacterium]